MKLKGISSVFRRMDTLSRYVLQTGVRYSERTATKLNENICFAKCKPALCETENRLYFSPLKWKRIKICTLRSENLYCLPNENLFNFENFEICWRNENLHFAIEWKSVPFTKENLHFTKLKYATLCTEICIKPYWSVYVLSADARQTLTRRDSIINHQHTGEWPNLRDDIL